MTTTLHNMAMKLIVRERRHRLPKERYLGRIAVAFTATERSRRMRFATASIARELGTILIEAVTTYQANAVVYLFMPDHLHCILSGNNSDSDVLSAMKRFKQRSGYWLTAQTPETQWQKGFYDHIIRSNSDLVNHIRYILYNPVRAGLVDDWRQYPYKGSTMYDLNSWCAGV